MIRAVLTAAAFLLGAPMANGQDTIATVVEIATFDFAEGVTAKTFVPVDARVQVEHVSRQPALVSRETGATEMGWVAIVHWETAEAAQTSTDNFADAPAAVDFMGLMSAEMMRITLYDIK